MRKTGKKHKMEEPLRRPVPVLETNPETGLSSAQAQDRMDAGWATCPSTPRARPWGRS